MADLTSEVEGQVIASTTIEAELTDFINERKGNI
jgi:hypothetical protein